MKNLTLCVAIVFMTLAFSSIGLADNNICLANNSQHTIYKVNSTGGVIADVIYNETCNLGCNIISGVCNPNPADNAIFFFLFPLTALVILYLISTTKPEDWPLHLLGVGIALFLIIIPFGTLTSSMPNHFTAAYQLLTVSALIIMIYYVLKLMATALKAAEGK